MTTGDLVTLNVLLVLQYESPVVNRRKLFQHVFLQGLHCEILFCYEIILLTKLTISTKVLGYMQNFSLNDYRKLSSLRFSHNSVTQVSFQFVDQYVFILFSDTK